MNLVQKKKVCILPQKLGLGGPVAFQGGLISVLQRRGIDISSDPLEAGNAAILVFGAARNTGEIVLAQRAGVRVVQRLNGMNWVHRRRFTGIKHFIKAEYGNLKLRRLRKSADGIIYQSAFARSWWEREDGRLEKPQFVIHNGVDLEFFSPDPVTLPPDRYRVLMVEGHHGGGYDQGLVTAARLLQQLRNLADRACELAVVGDVPAALKQEIDNFGVTVKWLGVVQRTEIPAIDRSAHLLFSGDVNASCPNSVIEAMACGLPVVAYDTGALPELVSTDAGRIAPYGADVWKLEPPDIASLANATWQVLQNRQALSRGARVRAGWNFDIERVADRYLTVLLGE